MTSVSAVVLGVLLVLSLALNYALLQQEEECACPNNEGGLTVAAHPRRTNDTVPPVTAPPTTLGPSSASPVAADPTPSPSTAHNGDAMRPPPPVALFMGRKPETHDMPDFVMHGWRFNDRADSVKVEGATPMANCSDRCRASSACHFWTLSNETAPLACTLHAAMPPGIDMASTWRLGLQNVYRSGTARRRFTMWTDPGFAGPRSQRTLLVVNWHWPTDAERLMMWMNLNAASTPADVDIVHCTVNMRSGALSNPWTMQGYQSHISLLVAYRALPGYRGYFLTNDDSFIRWDNMPLDKPHRSWLGGRRDLWNGKAIRPIPIGDATRAAWVWLGDVQPFNHDDRNRAGLGPNGRERYIEALASLGMPAPKEVYFETLGPDLFYIAGVDMPLAARLFQAFANHGYFLELSIPAVFHFIEEINKNPMVIFYGLTPSAGNFMDTPPGWASNHPLKLSQPASRDVLWRYHNFTLFGEPMRL